MQSPVPQTPATSAIPRTLQYGPLHPDTGAGNLHGSEEIRREEQREERDTVKKRYGKHVKDMNSAELVLYLEGSYVNDTVARNVEASGIAGRDWLWTLDRVTTAEAFKEEIGPVSLLQLAKLVREANEGSKDRTAKGSSARKEKRSPGKHTHAGKKEREGESKAPTGQRMGADQHEHEDSGSDEQSERTRRSAKTDKCPKLPDFENERGLCTRNEWDDYTQSMMAWIGMYSGEFCDIVDRIKNDPTKDYDHQIGSLDPDDCLLDRKWAISIRDSGLHVRNRVRCKTKSVVKGRPSGAKMFVTLSRVVDAKSPKLTHKLINAFSNWKPVGRIEDLLVEMNTWESALEKIQDMGTTLTDSQKVGSLESLATTIKLDHVHLAADIRALLKADPNDFQGYWDALDEYVTEMQAELYTGDWTTEGSANAVDVERRHRPCISFRETGTCDKGSACSYAHIKGDTACINEGFVNRGFCTEWLTCNRNHPKSMRPGGELFEKRKDKKKRKEYRKKKKKALAAEKLAAAAASEGTVSTPTAKTLGI